MARMKLMIASLGICVLASACEKAKMRTVPPKNQNPGAVSAAPSLPPPQEPQDNLKDGPPAAPERPAPRASAPPPPPPQPVARLDEGDSRVRTSSPAPTPPRRASDLSERRRGDVVVVEEACEPPIERPIVRPRPRPRPITRPRPARRPPAVQEVIVVDERQAHDHFVLGIKADLHCRWEPTGKPMSYLRYDPIRQIAWTQTGWPQVWAQYTGVKLVSGLPPYFNKGVTLVTRKGKPIASLKGTGAGTIWYERDTRYPYEAYWGVVPGAPQGESRRGVCWTAQEPAKTEEIQ